MIKKILQGFFSIRNSENKKHKIICILGVKIKFAINSAEKKSLAVFKNINSPLLYLDKEKFKNNFLLFKYDYLNVSNQNEVNLGDYVQTIATQSALISAYKDVPVSYWDRDNLLYYEGEPAFTIMQGWFSHSNNYLPNEKILPIFIGTHIAKRTQDNFTEAVKINKKYFKSITIGCRDTETLKFMQNIGLKSYLSRCLTLTLPKREKKSTQNKNYIVDIPDEMLKYIPENIKENAIFVNQRCYDTNKNKSYYVDSEKRYLKKTFELLKEYKNNAKLVITSALHCASPCIAMGIPTILIDFEEKNDRFGSLDGIFEIKTVQDLINQSIDFNPKSIDLEELKELMIKNVKLSIRQAFDEIVDVKELDDIRNRIANYKVHLSPTPRNKFM